MADVIVKYGDLSPRNGNMSWGALLKRAVPGIVTERTAQVKTAEQRKGKTITFRRYEKLEAATAPLMEGVTPSGKQVSYTDVSVTLEQFGDYIEITDVIVDTHEDPIESEFKTILSEQMKETKETLNFDVLKGGTGVLYTNGTARNAVNTVIDRGDIRRAVRDLRGANCSFFTEILDGSPKVGTTPVASSFFAFSHTDAQADIENITGFKAVHEYGDSMKGVEYEVGAASNVRFILTTLCTPWADAGAAGSTMLATTAAGTAVDVYPLIIVAPDAWGVVPLRGKDSGNVAVVNPKPVAGDPLGQRGTLGWKMWHAGLILDDNRMLRVEMSCTANPT